MDRVRPRFRRASCLSGKQTDARAYRSPDEPRRPRPARAGPCRLRPSTASIIGAKRSWKFTAAVSLLRAADLKDRRRVGELAPIGFWIRTAAPPAMRQAPSGAPRAASRGRKSRLDRQRLVERSEDALDGELLRHALRPRRVEIEHAGDRVARLAISREMCVRDNRAGANRHDRPWPRRRRPRLAKKAGSKLTAAIFSRCGTLPPPATTSRLLCALERRLHRVVDRPPFLRLRVGGHFGGVGRAIRP